VGGTHQADWDVWSAQGEVVNFTGISVYRVQDVRLTPGQTLVVFVQRGGC